MPSAARLRGLGKRVSLFPETKTGKWLKLIMFHPFRGQVQVFAALKEASQIRFVACASSFKWSLKTRLDGTLLRDNTRLC